MSPRIGRNFPSPRASGVAERGRSLQEWTPAVRAIADGGVVEGTSSGRSDWRRLSPAAKAFAASPRWPARGWRMPRAGGFIGRLRTHVARHPGRADSGVHGGRARRDLVGRRITGPRHAILHHLQAVPSPGTSRAGVDRGHHDEGRDRGGPGRQVRDEPWASTGNRGRGVATVPLRGGPGAGLPPTSIRCPCSWQS
jgi:hypothetical protein